MPIAENERSLKDIVKGIIGNIQDIVRSEVRLAKAELADQAVNARSTHRDGSGCARRHLFPRTITCNFRPGTCHRAAGMDGGVDCGGSCRHSWRELDERRNRPASKTEFHSGKGHSQCPGEHRMGERAEQMISVALGAGVALSTALGARTT